MGCQDGTFTIEILLHLHHNQNLPTYVVVMDLVKAFGTVNHKMMLNILTWYAPPPKLCSKIERMYTHLKVFLKIGKIEDSISQTIGVQHGDCMAPAPLLFMVTVFEETIEK